MKKFLKRMCLCLAAAISFSCLPLLPSANENSNWYTSQLEETMRNMLSALCDSPEALGYTDEEVKNAYVSSPYIISNSEDTENFVVNFPVCNDEDVIGIITATYHEQSQKYAVSIGKSHGDLLNEALKEHDVVTVNNNEGELSAEQYLPIATASYSTAPLPEAIDSSLPVFDNMEINSFPTTRGVVTGSRYVSLGSYPTQGQEGKNLCWAATISSMMKYEGVSITGQSVVSTTTVANASKSYWDFAGTGVCPGIDFNYVDDVLKLFFKSSTYSPNTFNTTLTFAQIKKVINKDDPIYISSYSYNAFVNHATALYGYRTDYEGVYMMDPIGYGTTSLVNLIDGYIVYTNNNDTYEYDSTGLLKSKSTYGI